MMSAGPGKSPRPAPGSRLAAGRAFLAAQSGLAAGPAWSESVPCTVSNVWRLTLVCLAEYQFFMLTETCRLWAE